MAQYHSIISTDERITAKYPQYFQLADRILITCDSAVGKLEQRQMQFSNLSMYQLVLLALFQKSQECFLSCSTLCGAGRPRPVRCIARALIETTVTIRYISKGRKKRSELFLAHQAVERKFLAEAAIDKKKYGKLIAKELKKSRSQIEQDYLRFKRKFPAAKSGDIKNDYRFDWSGRKFSKMAKMAKMSRASTPYWLFSKSIHTSAVDCDEYVDFSTKRFGPQNGIDEVPAILVLISELLTAQLELMESEFALNLQSDIADLKKEALGLGLDPVCE